MPQSTDVNTVIVGLGATGLACARFLARRGERFAVTDSRDDPPGRAALERELPEVPLALGGFDPALLRRARTVVLSPGVAPDDPRLRDSVRAGAEVIGDIELFARHADAPVIAVTGSNGKSTVTTLLAEMFRTAGRSVRVGGNLGTPALDLLEGAPPRAYVLELSSFQLETTYSLDAAVATLLNISADHLDRHRDLERYAAAKARVFRGHGVMVLNADDPVVAALAQPGRRVRSFGLDPMARPDYGLRMHRGVEWLACGSEPLLPVAELGLHGRHNVANALAALAVADVFGLPRAALARTLASFTGLPHRCRRIARAGGVDWFDDSKGTNVGAACAAIAGLDAYERLVLIAGGEGKGQHFAPLAEAARGRLRAAVLIGRDAPALAAALAGVATIVHATDMDEAVAHAARAARPGDAVLLSPACASQDMFRDYAARGEAFAAAVRRLAGEGPEASGQRGVDGSRDADAGGREGTP